MRAPVLLPGSYDADALLRHRARSIGGESVEAEQEWSRTGGHFARVGHVRASKEAALSPSSTPSSPSAAPDSASHRAASPSPTIPSVLTPPESPRHAFRRVGNIGVDGALGYFDTDVDDSGIESGRNSPEMRRSPAGSVRGGLAGTTSLGFTPVLTQGARSVAEGRASQEALARSVDSSTSSDRHMLEGEALLPDAHAAAAADLEAPSVTFVPSKAS